MQLKLKCQKALHSEPITTHIPIFITIYASARNITHIKIMFFYLNSSSIAFCFLAASKCLLTDSSDKVFKILLISE